MQSIRQYHKNTDKKLEQRQFNCFGATLKLT